MLKFYVLRVLLERRDWDSVVELLPKAVNGIVDDQHVFETDVFENSKVLDVEIVSLNAGLSVEAVLDELVLGVNIIEDRVRVLSVRRGKHTDFEVPVRELQHFLCVRTNVETDRDDVLRRGYNVQGHIWVGHSSGAPDTVRQCLIKIEENNA